MYPHQIAKAAPPVMIHDQIPSGSLEWARAATPVRAIVTPARKPTVESFSIGQT
jgi:hypothetical protein